jgi:hypothetical protein
VDAVITGFSDAVTVSGSGVMTVSLTVSTTGAVTCTVDNGVGAVNCNGTTNLATNPTTTTLYTLTVTNEDAGGATTTAQTTVFCGPTSQPDSATGCPTGATVFCEAVAIDPTNALHAQQQAQDACNVCVGGGCTNVSNDPNIGGASDYFTTNPNSASYVYSVGTGPVGPGLCSNSTYVAQPGDILGFPAATCPDATW